MKGKNQYKLQSEVKNCCGHLPRKTGGGALPRPELATLVRNIWILLQFSNFERVRGRFDTVARDLGRLIVGIGQPENTCQPTTLWIVLPTRLWSRLGSALKKGRPLLLRSCTVSWVPSAESGVHHPLSPVIGLGFQKERKNEKKGLRKANADRQEIIFPSEFAMCFEYQNVDKTEIQVCAQLRYLRLENHIAMAKSDFSCVETFFFSRSRHCAVVLQTQVPKLCTDLDLDLL